MEKMEIEQITKALVTDENTTELSRFWAKKYEMLLSHQYISFAQHTLDLLFDNTVASYIPEGIIHLKHHFNENGTLNEDMLVSTVEVLVRLLDGVVSHIADMDFVHVNEYRDIKIRLDDTDVDIQNTDLDLNYVAELIAETAYRASEFIADEKGSFDFYNQKKHDYRENQFDNWLQKDGTIINIDPKNNPLADISENELTLVPRRNYCIIDFSNIPSISKYSDLYQESVDQDLDQTTHVNQAEQNISTTKPFNITIPEKQPSSPKPLVNNHIDQIFQHLLKEQKKDEIPVHKTEPVQPASNQTISEKKGYGVRLYVVIEHRGKYIFFKDQNKLSLPYFEFDSSTNTTQKLRDGLLKKYNLLVKIDKEFGVYFNRREGQSVNIGFGASLENHSLPQDLFWTAPGDGNFLTDISLNLILKYQESITKEIEIPRQDTQPSAQKQVPYGEQKPAEKLPQEIRENVVQKEFKPMSFTKKNQTKITYGFRLNQKIQTRAFGDVEIVFEYSKACPQIVEYHCQILKEQDKHSLDIIISLINLLILCSYDLDQLEEYLETRVKSDENNTINNFITVLVFAFREVPNSVEELGELLG
jgi:hypothetical protein